MLFAADRVLSVMVVPSAHHEIAASDPFHGVSAVWAQPNIHLLGGLEQRLMFTPQCFSFSDVGFPSFYSLSHLVKPGPAILSSQRPVAASEHLNQLLFASHPDDACQVQLHPLVVGSSLRPQRTGQQPCNKLRISLRVHLVRLRLGNQGNELVAVCCLENLVNKRGSGPMILHHLNTKLHFLVRNAPQLVLKHHVSERHVMPTLACRQLPERRGGVHSGPHKFVGQQVVDAHFEVLPPGSRATDSLEEKHAQQSLSDGPGKAPGAPVQKSQQHFKILLSLVVRLSRQRQHHISRDAVHYFDLSTEREEGREEGTTKAIQKLQRTPVLLDRLENPAAEFLLQFCSSLERWVDQYTEGSNRRKESG
mmetsp:Transcript_38362/g.78647  ORF Transcript_38362/g.78647 Transcript_38362/m.78647 type:complete len:364 (+) Transcript_38362:1085-2176(+)